MGQPSPRRAGAPTEWVVPPLSRDAGEEPGGEGRCYGVAGATAGT
jgi:hypothetical protein